MERIGRALLCLAALGLGTTVAVIPWPVVGSMTAAVMDLLFAQSRAVVSIISTGPGEPFFGYLYLAAILGQAMALPVIAYQILAFVAPDDGVDRNSKLRAAAAGVGLASLVGLVLAYLLIPFMGFAFQSAHTLEPPALHSGGVVILQPVRGPISPRLYLADAVDVLDMGALAFALPALLVALSRVGTLSRKQFTDE